MTRSTLRRLAPSTLVGIAAALIALQAGSARAADSVTKHETWNWSGTVAPGRTLAVYGVNGGISAVPAQGGQVEVVAEKTGRREDPSEVKIEVTPTSDGVTICAVYPGMGSACDGHGWHSHGNRDNDVRVEFQLRVPPGVKLVAETVNGDVGVHGLSGTVRARTVNGGCTLETSRSGEASTVNGSVTATLGEVPADESLRFATVNGSITLNLPAELNAELDGGTVNGGIETDFPVTVSGRWGPRSLHGVVGRGGAHLKLSTVNGGIALHRSASQ